MPGVSGSPRQASRTKPCSRQPFQRCCRRSRAATSPPTSGACPPTHLLHPLLLLLRALQRALGAAQLLVELISALHQLATLLVQLLNVSKPAAWAAGKQGERPQCNAMRENSDGALDSLDSLGPCCAWGGGRNARKGAAHT